MSTSLMEAKPVPAIEAVVGKKVYVDSEGNEYKNPAAGWPVLGSLFGSAINIEIAARDALGTTKKREAFDGHSAWEAYKLANPNWADPDFVDPNIL